MILPPSFSIRKTGNLYQLRHKDFGTVFQSHDRKECERYANNPPSSVLTMELPDNGCYHECVCPRKYGKLTKRP